MHVPRSVSADCLSFPSSLRVFPIIPTLQDHHAAKGTNTGHCGSSLPLLPCPLSIKCWSPPTHPPIHRDMTPFPSVSLPPHLHQQHRSEKHQSSCSKKPQPHTSTVNSVAPDAWDDWLLARDTGEMQEGPSWCLLLPAAVAAASSARSRSFSCRSRSSSRWWCLCSSSITCWWDDSISARLRSQASC